MNQDTCRDLAMTPQEVELRWEVGALPPVLVHMDSQLVKAGRGWISYKHVYFL